jgi:hypothetical protein
MTKKNTKKKEWKLTFKVFAFAHFASFWLAPPLFTLLKSPPFFRFLKLWKLEAFKAKP